MIVQTKSMRACDIAGSAAARTGKVESRTMSRLGMKKSRSVEKSRAQGIVLGVGREIHEFVSSGSVASTDNGLTSCGCPVSCRPYMMCCRCG